MPYQRPSATRSLYSGCAALVLLALALVLPAPTAAQSAAAAAATPSSPAWYDPEGWDLAEAPTRGPEDALVTLVVFTDFECPFCARLADTLDELVADPAYADDVRLVVKQFPLSFHRQARPAARAALAAHAQGAFWPFHDALFARQSDLGERRYDELAADLGLDLSAFGAARLDGGAADDQVEADMALGATLGVRGTPQTFVNGLRVPGAQPLEAFEAAVETERAAMQALLDAGASREDAMRQRVAANRQANEADAAAPPSSGTPSANVPMRVPVDDALQLGPDDALVTIVAFVDLECPFSARSWSTARTLLDRYAPDVRLVVRHYPLSNHPNAEPAARAVLAAGEDGAALLDAYFARGGTLAGVTLDEVVADAGLDATTLAQGHDAPDVDAALERDAALVDELAVSGTPHFFVNGYRVRGAQPLTTFAQLVERERARAIALIELGVEQADVYEALQLSAQQQVVYEAD